MFGYGMDPAELDLWATLHELERKSTEVAIGPLQPGSDTVTANIINEFNMAPRAELLAGSWQ